MNRRAAVGAALIFAGVLVAVYGAAGLVTWVRGLDLDAAGWTVADLDGLSDAAWLRRFGGPGQ